MPVFGVFWSLFSRIGTEYGEIRSNTETFHAVSLFEKDGIVLNQHKFQLCQDTVEFAGLLLTADVISSFPKILAAINDFPVPKGFTGIC